MKRIRVLEMIDRPFLGGGQVNLLSLVRSLDREVFECAVCSGGEGPLARAVREAGIPYFAAPLKKRSGPGDLRRIRTMISSFRPDILHTHGGVAGLFGRMAARRADGPLLVHTLHGIHYLHYRNPLLRAALIGLEKWFSRLSHAVICVSAGDLDRARRLRLAPENRLVLIRNGIDAPPGFVRTAAGERAGGNAVLEEAGGPLVGTVARLHRQKGLSDLIDAAGPVRDRFPDVRFRIVGGGPLESALWERIRRRGCGDFVRILGEREDAVSLMSGFDLFVLPSLWEGLPYVLLEAGLRGIPVVATDVEGNRELIEAGKTGRLVRPADPADLADGIIQALSSPGETSQMADELRRRVARDYTLEEMVRRTAALYRRLFTRGSSGGGRAASSN